jgi:hypothetical protein
MIRRVLCTLACVVVVPLLWPGTHPLHTLGLLVLEFVAAGGALCPITEPMCGANKYEPTRGASVESEIEQLRRLT